MARLDSFRASVRFYRRSSVWLLYIFASEARSVGDSLTVERSSRGRSIRGDAYIRDVAHDDLVMSLWPKTLDRMTRSAVTLLFQIGRVWRAPRPRSAFAFGAYD